MLFGVLLQACLLLLLHVKLAIASGKTLLIAIRSKPSVHVTRDMSRLLTGVTPRGGALGYFLGWYVSPGIRTPNLHPVLNKISPKIDTSF